ncbi:MAG: hypothetical protein KF810_23915 [Rhizobiaceae bacterium]|nr:hypothetical protein [Rhizobiaceae bacterium]
MLAAVGGPEVGTRYHHLLDAQVVAARAARLAVSLVLSFVLPGSRTRSRPGSHRRIRRRAGPLSFDPFRHDLRDLARSAGGGMAFAAVMMIGVALILVAVTWNAIVI